MKTNGSGGGGWLDASPPFPGRGKAPAPEKARRKPIGATVSALYARFGEFVTNNLVASGDQDVVYVEPRGIREVLHWLRSRERYDHLADLTAVDPGRGETLEVVYQLWSIPRKKAVRIKAVLPQSDPRIDSVTPIWQGANWLEREVYDMFGIVFEGHPDLRRILMPQNYAEGHPLRKDFPLRGRLSREEQTLNALSLDEKAYYRDEDLAGRNPQGILFAEPEKDGEKE